MVRRLVRSVVLRSRSEQGTEANAIREVTGSQDARTMLAVSSTVQKDLLQSRDDDRLQHVWAADLGARADHVRAADNVYL